MTAGVLLIIIITFGEIIVIGFAVAARQKKILEYTGSIHRPNCWLQELFAYDISIIYYAVNIMKDVDTCSRYINTRMYRYLAYAYAMRYRDTISRISSLFQSSHVTATFPSTLHYSSIRYYQLPYSFHLSTQPLTTNH